jgi:hypothetical protein
MRHDEALELELTQALRVQKKADEAICARCGHVSIGHGGVAECTKRVKGYESSHFTPQNQGKQPILGP